LINNYFGTGVNVIQAINAHGQCDFTLTGSATGQPASFSISGGATLFTTPVTGSASCSPSSTRIIIGSTGINASNCGFCHNAIFPGADSFNYLGTPMIRWNSLYVNQACANAYNTLSDIRAKEDLEPLTNSLEKLKTLDAFYYDLKSEHQGNVEKKRAIGLISQQVEKVFPEVVTEDGGFLHLEYSKLVAVLVESTKELSEEIDKREITINELTEIVKTQQQQIKQLTSLVSAFSSTASSQEALIKQMMNKN